MIRWLITKPNDGFVIFLNKNHKIWSAFKFLIMFNVLFFLNKIGEKH